MTNVASLDFGIRDELHDFILQGDTLSPRTSEFYETIPAWFSYNV